MTSPRRSVLATAGWVDAGAAHGLSAEELLEGTGLKPSDLARLDRLVEPRQELLVIQRLALALPGQDGLGVLAGMSCTVGSLGPFALACLSVENVGQAIHEGVMLLGLSFAFVTPVLEPRGADLIVTMDDRRVLESVRPHVMERDLTAFLQIIDAISPTLNGIRICTALGPGSIDALARVAHGIPVDQGVRSTIALPAAVLASRTRQANPAVAADWIMRAESELRRRVGTETLAMKVRTEVARAVRDPPTAAELASGLHVDERTLRRHLARERTSYRAIVDEARRTLALDLMRYGELSVERIAAETGYSDAAAFSAAFKRWHGESPGRFRQRTLDAGRVYA